MCPQLPGKIVQLSFDIIWETLQRDIPRLKLQLLDLLAREDPPVPR